MKDAGCLIEPPVSVPIVAGVRLAAKAEAEPPDDPPGTILSPNGFVTFPKKLVSLDEPIANSSQFNLPSKKAPSNHNLFVTVDSYVGRKLFKILLPAVVLTSLVQNISLTAIGMPGNKPLGMFFLSKFFADTKASSKHFVIYVFSLSELSAFFINDFVTSSEVKSLFFIPLTKSTIEKFVKSVILFHHLRNYEKFVGFFR